MINRSGKDQMQTARLNGLTLFTIIALMSFLVHNTIQSFSLLLGGLVYFLAESIRIQIAFSAQITQPKSIYRRMITSSIAKAFVLLSFFIFIDLSGNFDGFFVSLGLVGSMISHRIALFRR